MKSRTINIILIIAVILFFYLWISKPTKVQDNSKRKTDSLELIISHANDSLLILKQQKDSFKCVNMQLLYKIGTLKRDKSILNTKYEKSKSYLLNTTTSEDMKIFKSYVK